MTKTKPEKMPSGYFGWAIIDGQAGLNNLTGALHNLSISETPDPNYGRGVLMGVLSTLMATGMTFDDSCQLVWQTMPNDCHPGCFPDGFEKRFTGKVSK